eukprot:TRINITY_DN6509_c0_g1_i1.p1 TRINITY_DN6509_c0_g1~~TRINITY_DN6509_c0_g1_i1.p1  ORF type:complete len:326 (-),score=40.27 TRINITY_DN6509_c0_g1_i1:67-1044(-)
MSNHNANPGGEDGGAGITEASIEPALLDSRTQQEQQQPGLDQITPIQQQHHYDEIEDPPLTSPENLEPEQHDRERTPSTENDATNVALVSVAQQPVAEPQAHPQYQQQPPLQQYPQQQFHQQPYIQQYPQQPQPQQQQVQQQHPPPQYHQPQPPPPTTGPPAGYPPLLQRYPFPAPPPPPPGYGPPSQIVTYQQQQIGFPPPSPAAMKMSPAVPYDNSANNCQSYQGQRSVTAVCGHCGSEGRTKIVRSNNLWPFLFCSLICIVGVILPFLWFGCQFLPFLCYKQKVNHLCGTCGKEVDVYNIYETNPTMMCDEGQSRDGYHTLT